MLLAFGYLYVNVCWMFVNVRSVLEINNDNGFERTIKLLVPTDDGLEFKIIYNEQ